MKRTAPHGVDIQTNIQTTIGHADSMTESAQWGRFSEKMWYLNMLHPYAGIDNMDLITEHLVDLELPVANFEHCTEVYKRAIIQE